MIRALVFLLFQSWKNRLVTRVQRLKQPKYLGGAVVGGLYFYWYFYRWVLNPRRLGGGIHLTPETLLWLEPLAALILFCLAILSWVLPHDRAALVFTEAEVAFLFPAPVKRRTLIYFKLIKTQLRILMAVLFLTIVSTRFLAGGIAWMHAISWWSILSAINLYNLGSSFTLTLALDKGISNWKRRAIVLTVVAAIVSGVFVWAKNTIPPPDTDTIQNADDVRYYVEHALNAGPALYLLTPFRLLIRPYFQDNLVDFAKALLPTLALLWLLYLWVVNTNIAFEEASIAASSKMAERLANLRANRGRISKPAKKKRAPFKLRPVGFPALAFLWKSLIGAGQIFTLRFWIFIFVFAFIFATRTGGTHGHSTAPWMIIVSTVSTMLLAMSFLIGPQFFRQDFRSDLPMADVLKTYPMRGWQIALGELFAPVAILTCAQWLLVIISSGTLRQGGVFKIPADMLLGLAMTAAILAPGLNFITLIIPNAAVLLFPGWFQTGKDAPRGVEATGQRMIFAVGQLLVLIAALIPAAIVFAVIFFIVKIILGVMSVVLPLAAIGGLIVLASEAALGILWLGRLFEKFDVAGDVAAPN